LGGPTEGLESLVSSFCPFLVVNTDWEQVKLKPNLWKGLNIQWILGDACNLPLRDKCVDYIISNAVIEHIPKENWPKYAAEIARVAKRGYFICAPDFWYPVEQHYLLPFFHWVPCWLTKPLITKPIFCPTKTDLKMLFPDARISGLDRILSQTIVAYKAVE